MISNATKPIAVRGCCHLFCALDIGFAVDLKQCAGLIREAREGYGFHHHARTPPYLNLRPLPVHASQTIEPIRGQTYCSEDRVTITIYDFGAVSVKYRVPFEGALEQLAALSSELYDNQRSPPMPAAAESLLETIGPAVKRPKVRAVEDYLVFEVPELEGDDGDPERFLSENGQVLAQVLGSNTEALSAATAAGRALRTRLVLRQRPDDHHLERRVGVRKEHGGRTDRARAGERSIAGAALSRRSTR